MHISYNWLKELLPDLKQSPEEVAEVLTMGLFETEIATTIAIDPLTTVVKISKVEPHPNADRLRLATIDTGVREETIVCGAPNIAAGQLVPFSSPGATVRDEDGSNFKLKMVTIRGVDSPGMLNSPRELSLGDWHGGIYVLPDDVPVGSRLNEHIPDDVVLEVELTPNRAHDCYSHRGIARELGALLNLVVAEPVIINKQYDELQDWELEVPVDDHDTRAYFGTLLEEVTVKPSPMWLQARLWSVGARPINNVVDVTNLVMFEMGGPTHAFDADKLPGQKINSRRAKAGETVTTLDSQTHKLTDESLVVTSNDEPVALAGVMGGQTTEVDEKSSRLFLEVANFYPYTVYRSSIVHGLMSEGSQRWVKDVPTALAKEASDRTIALLGEVTGASVIGQMSQPATQAKSALITFDPERPTKVAGVAVTKEQVKDTLLRQRCGIDDSGDMWRVTPPADRIDLTGQHDLVEDVLRLVGYNTIEPIVPSREKRGNLPSDVQWREVIRNLLRDEGFTEVINASFEDSRIPDSGIAASEAEALIVANPAAPELAKLRTTLEPMLLYTVLSNRAELSRKGATEQALFEFGKIFTVGDGLVEGVHEEEQLVCVLVGARATETEARDLVNKISETTGVPLDQINTVIREVPRSSALGKKARVSLHTIVIDFWALVSAIPEEGKHTTYIPTNPPGEIKYEPFSKYPAVYRDVSLVVSETVTVEQVQESIVRTGGALIADVDLFDEYADTDGRQSYGFRIAYQAADRTLTGKEVAEIHNQIVQQLHDDLGADLRE